MPRDHDQPDESKIQYLQRFLLFVLMGCGASWIFPNAMAQQIPSFESELPGGLCIATFMNAATNFSFIAVVVFVSLNSLLGPFPSSICVPILLTVGAIGAFLASATYTITMNGLPVMLLVCCAIGGAVGGLSNVIMNPFLTRYKNDYISASRSGSSVGTLLTAMLAAVQNPGSKDHRRFSTSLYLLSFGIILSFPILSYTYIVRHGVGLREPLISSESDRNNSIKDNIRDTQHSSAGIDDHSSRDNADTDIINVLHGYKALATVTADCSEHHGIAGIELRTITEHGGRENPDDLVEIELFGSALSANSINDPMPSTADSHGYSTLPRVDMEKSGPLLGNSSNEKSLCSWLPHGFIPKCLLRFFDKNPWFIKTLPYMCSIGWVNLNQWGILSAVVPFAMANVSRHGGALTLSIAYEFGAIGLLAGDLSTIYFRVPLPVCVLVFTACAFSIYACALGLVSNDSAIVPPFLIVIWTISRFLEAHVSTSSYRCIATEFPIQYREYAARACGLTDQVCTTCGTVISTSLVSSYGGCSI